MKIYMDNVALTKDIQDEARLNMAYNVLYNMAQSGVKLAVDGTQEQMDAGKLHALDNDGNSFRPELDGEWFGTEEQNNAAREAVLDKIGKEMEACGEEFDREHERELMDQYTVSWRAWGVASVYFAPNSWDIDRARDIYSILHNDLDGSVGFSKDTKYDGTVKLDLATINVVDTEGGVYDPEKNDSQDFADAVAQIPAEEAGLEQ